MIHRRRLSKAALGTLRERERPRSQTVVDSEIDTVRETYTCTHSVTDVFPIGALARKSLAIGFTQRTNTMTGERKLMCSSTLQVVTKI